MAGERCGSVRGAGVAPGAGVSDTAEAAGVVDVSDARVEANAPDASGEVIPDALHEATESASASVAAVSSCACEARAQEASASLGGPAELDYLYNEVDKLYAGFARGCGLSSCAFWMLYDLHRAQAPLALQKLGDSWSYSKQTMNSALKALEAKGLIAYAYVEGSRKCKTVALTDAGVAFALAHVQPAIDAEGRAFRSLAVGEQRTLVYLVRKYAAALDVEIGRAARMQEDACGELGDGAASAAADEKGMSA